jgi:hypothetical protein
VTDTREESLDFLTTLAQAGIACPPTGVAIADVKTIGPWHWGTTDALRPRDLYMFEVKRVVEHFLDVGPAFVLCHYGHGVNSYGLNLVTWGGPIAAFVQHHYNGIYSDPVRDLVSINATYSRLHELLTAAAKREGPLRWLMVFSSFRGVCGLIDVDRVRSGEPWPQTFDPADEESALFRATVEKVADSFFNLDRIRW